MNQARLGKNMLPELRPIEQLSTEAAQQEIAKLQDDLRQYGIAYYEKDVRAHTQRT